jgi:hypothetical protein
MATSKVKLSQSPSLEKGCNFPEYRKTAQNDAKELLFRLSLYVNWVMIEKPPEPWAEAWTKKMYPVVGSGFQDGPKDSWPPNLLPLDVVRTVDAMFSLPGWGWGEGTLQL